MVVGHNFDSEAGFEYSFNGGGINLRGPTWKNLLAFLEHVEILPEKYGYTNAYVGLQSGKRAIRPFPR